VISNTGYAVCAKIGYIYEKMCHTIAVQIVGHLTPHSDKTILRLSFSRGAPCVHGAYTLYRVAYRSKIKKIFFTYVRPVASPGFCFRGGGHENSSLFFLNRLMSLLYLYLYYNNLVTITNLQTKFQSLSHSH
jgi:hypothetical protein